MVEPKLADVPATAHKAWVGGALAAVSMLAGIMLGAMQVIVPDDIAAATGMPTERVGAWFRIIIAILVAVAGAGAVTGASVYRVSNRPKP